MVLILAQKEFLCFLKEGFEKALFSNSIKTILNSIFVHFCVFCLFLRFFYVFMCIFIYVFIYLHIYVFVVLCLYVNIIVL